MRIQHARVSQAISTGMSGLSASKAFQLFVHTLPGRSDVPLSFVYAVVGCTESLVFSRTVRELCRGHSRTAYPTTYVVDSRLRSHRRRFFLQVHQLIEDVLAECLKTTICTAANRKRGGHALNTVLFYRGLLDGGG